MNHERHIADLVGRAATKASLARDTYKHQQVVPLPDVEDIIISAYHFGYALGRAESNPLAGIVNANETVLRAQDDLKAAVLAAHAQGVAKTEIAKRVNASRSTIDRWIEIAEQEKGL